MNDESSTRDMRRDTTDASRPDLSTADLAVAANRSEGGSTADLDRKIDDRLRRRVVEPGGGGAGL